MASSTRTRNAPARKTAARSSDSSLGLWLAVAALWLILDQFTKVLIVQNYQLGDSTFVTNFFNVVRVHNYGAAWSSLSGKTVFLVVVNVLILLAVAWLLVKKIVRHPLGVWGCVPIIIGGIGNIIDRVWHGYVVDMFHLQFMEFPIFNLADCFVVVGVILSAVYYLWFFEKYDSVKKEKPHGTDMPESHK